MKNFIAVTSILFSIFIMATFAQEATETSSESLADRMFGCIQPCWNDIYVGVTTASDLENILANHPDVRDVISRGEIDPITGILQNGSYGFSYGEWTRIDSIALRPNVNIQIRDGVVINLYIIMGENITLQEIMNVLGQPTEVRYELGGYDFTYIKLIYLDYLLVIRLKDNYDNPCHLESIQTDLHIETISYYDAETAYFPVDGYLGGQQSEVAQPLILHYSRRERFVPNRVWQTWLGNEELGSCDDAWNLLPENAPISVTTTPINNNEGE